MGGRDKNKQKAKSLNRDFGVSDHDQDDQDMPGPSRKLDRQPRTPSSSQPKSKYGRFGPIANDENNSDDEDGELSTQEMLKRIMQELLEVKREQHTLMELSTGVRSLQKSIDDLAGMMDERCTLMETRIEQMEAKQRTGQSETLGLRVEMEGLKEQVKEILVSVNSAVPPLHPNPGVPAPPNVPIQNCLTFKLQGIEETEGEDLVAVVEQQLRINDVAPEARVHSARRLRYPKDKPPPRARTVNLAPLAYCSQYDHLGMHWISRRAGGS